MAKTWGHEVRKLTQEEIDYQIKLGGNWYQWQVDHYHSGPIPEEGKCIHAERKCRISSKCHSVSTHMLKYWYVTGKQGRTSYAERPICEYHASKYVRDGVVLEKETNKN